MGILISDINSQSNKVFLNMTEPITDLIIETTKRIEELETRKRNRDPGTQLRFEHSVRTILIDLWKAIHSIPPRECLINKRSGYYSENPR